MTVIHLRHLTASVSSFSPYILQSGDTSCFSMNANDSSSLSSFPYSLKSSTNSRWLVDSPSLPNMHLALYYLRTIDRDIKQNSDSKKQSAWNMPRRILTSPRARPLAVCIVFQFCFPWWHVEHWKVFRSFAVSLKSSNMVPCHMPYDSHHHYYHYYYYSTDEISEVKILSINFVQKTLEKKGSSFTYILVPFSDPGRSSIYLMISFKYFKCFHCRVT